MKIKPHIYTEAVPELLMPKEQTITKRRKKYLSFHPLFLIFRSSFFIFSFSLFILNSYGQSPDQNYVKSMTYKKPSTQGIDPNNPAHVMTQVTYLDGLGRPIQQVGYKQSGEGTDMITHIEYDGFNRQPKDFLPYPSDQATMAYYNKNALITGLEEYYQTHYGDNNVYAEKLFEQSPLNRVLKQGAPGDTWKVTGNVFDHTIKFDYQSNKADEVKLFKVTTPANPNANGVYEPTLVNPSGTVYYTANQLYKNVITDENGSKTEEFKDKEGRVVLKRAYDGSEPHDTYYVYDIYNNLTFVIPPKAVDLGNISSTVLDNLCYRYKYDKRNRLIEKKLPGKQWEYIVYDKLDRVVATGPVLNPFQDQTNEGWLLTKYDVFGRVAYTGWKSETSISSSKRNVFQQEIDGLTKLYVHKLKVNIITDGVPIRYSNDVSPTIFKLLTVNYYDDYSYPGAPSPVPVTVEGDTVATALKGLPTGSWVRVLTTAMESPVPNEMSYTLYDEKARPIRTHSNNHTGGYTQVDIKLDFTGGMPEYTITRNKLITADNQVTVREDFDYTPQGRLLKHNHKINNEATEMLSHIMYDPLGQPDSKRVGNNLSTPLQTVNYSYNIRGWLTDINNIESLGNDLFAFRISYDKIVHPESGGMPVQFYSPLYNGNIAETYWRTSTDEVLRKYGYAYDKLNRLQGSVYIKPVSGTDPAMPVGNYNESLSYDKNGNIMNLIRYGDTDSPPVTAIDDLEYTYDNGNRLKKVKDNTGNPSGFKEGVYTGDAFIYDNYGNLIEDKNKGITSITYNHLNLPKEIIFENDENKKIIYLYNANGQKIKKTVVNSPSVSTVNYQGMFHYENGLLRFFATAEGYVMADTRGYNYVYNYTDHLGNIRLSYTDDSSFGLQVIEENNYYPFGLKHNGYNNISPLNNVYKYKYNGKEWQDELNLNLYDYGARNYDPAIGRWMKQDPHAENYYSFSPYSFVANNPMFFVDPNGKDIYLHYYLSNNYKDGKKDPDADEMFWASAITRGIDFINNGDMGSGDVLVFRAIDNMDDLKSTIESDIATYKDTFGKTSEFSLWSHSGMDGPFRETPNSLDQLSVENWGKINFNWSNNANAMFFGCRTGYNPSDWFSGEQAKTKQSFVQQLSSLENMTNVNVWGQTERSWPSPYTNARVYTEDIGNHNHKYPTYMVGSKKSKIVGFNTVILKQPTYGFPMSLYRNGTFIKNGHQKGKRL